MMLLKYFNYLVMKSNKSIPLLECACVDQDQGPIEKPFSQMQV